MGILRGSATTFLTGVVVGPLLLCGVIWGLVHILPAITAVFNALEGAAL